MLTRWPKPKHRPGALVVGEMFDPLSLSGPYFPRDQTTWAPAGPLLYDNLLTGSGHSFRIGGSGTGKTAALKLALSTTWRGPLVLLDPKELLTDELKEARLRMGRRVIVVDPYNSAHSGHNVLGWIDPTAPLLNPKIDYDVEWVCGNTPEHAGGDNTKFFVGAAKDIVRGIICHMMADPTIPDRTLRVPRTIICSPEKDFRDFLTAIHDTSPSARARELVAFVCSEGNDTVRSIQYTAQRITAWLSTPEWANLVCGDSFKAVDILDGNTDIFLPLPFQSLEAEPAVARCILGSLFNAVFQAKGKIPDTILFALDEIDQLRDFGPLKTALRMGREYKLAMHGLYQDTTQVARQWGSDGLKAITASSTWVSYAGIKDAATAKEISDMVGEFPVTAKSESFNIGSQGRAMERRSRSRGSTVTYSEMGKRRIKVEQVIGMRDDGQIVFARGIPPMICGIPADYRVQARKSTRRTISWLPRTLQRRRYG